MQNNKCKQIGRVCKSGSPEVRVRLAVLTRLGGCEDEADRCGLLRLEGDLFGQAFSEEGGEEEEEREG